MLATGDTFFVYPTKLREYQSRYRGSFLHGGVTPEECLHLGDSLIDDVHGAQAAGMKAVHIDALDLCGETDHPHAASLSEVVNSLVNTLRPS